MNRLVHLILFTLMFFTVLAQTNAPQSVDALIECEDAYAIWSPPVASSYTLIGYYVYVNGNAPSFVGIPDTNMFLGTYSSPTTFHYSVSAVYDTNNTILESDSLGMDIVMIDYLHPQETNITTNYSNVEISWDSIAQPGYSYHEIMGYNIYRDGEYIATAPAGDTSYTDIVGPCSYYYQVSTQYKSCESELNTGNSISLSANCNFIPDIYDIKHYPDSIMIYWTGNCKLNNATFNLYRNDQLLNSEPFDISSFQYQDTSFQFGIHTYKVSSLYGDCEYFSDDTIVEINDLPKPILLSVVPDCYLVYFNWHVDSADNNLIGYNIYRSHQIIDSMYTDTVYVDSLQGGVYQYGVSSLFSIQGDTLESAISPLEVIIGNIFPPKGVNIDWNGPNGSNMISWLTPHQFKGNWLSYNDGHFEDAIATDGEAGTLQLFIPEQHPVTIEAIRFYVMGEYMNDEEEVWILDGDGAQVLGGPYYINAVTRSWNLLDIDDLTIDSGNFVIATFNTQIFGPAIAIDNNYYSASLFFGKKVYHMDMSFMGYHAVGSHEVCLYYDNDTTAAYFEPNGYIIYRNNEIIAKPADSLTQFIDLYPPMYCCYRMSAVYGECESKVGKQLCNFPTSTDENVAEVNIFPNPGNELFNIQANKLIERIEVYNTSGLMVFNNAINSHNTEIRLNGPAGIYLIHLICDGSRTIQKLIKL